MEKTNKEVKVAKVVDERPTIQDIVIEQLAMNNDVEFQEVLKQVKAQYPDSRFSKACFYWYRRRTNAEGVTQPKINHPASKK